MLDFVQILLLPLTISDQVGGFTPILVMLTIGFVAGLGGVMQSRTGSVFFSVAKLILSVAVVGFVWTFATFAIVDFVWRHLSL